MRKGAFLLSELAGQTRPFAQIKCNNVKKQLHDNPLHSSGGARSVYHPGNMLILKALWRL